MMTNTAEDLGRKAFHAGIKCAPVLDRELVAAFSGTDSILGLCEAWLRGWHSENLAPLDVETCAASSTDRQYGRDDVDYETFYNPWMKQLAKAHAREALERRLGVSRAKAGRAARSHLRAIEATHSMTGQSQRRAQSRNVVAAAGDEAIAIRGALEIHDLFPEYAMATA